MDWALPGLRWMLYADLGVAYGVPLAAVVTGSRDVIARWRGPLAGAALAGIAIGAGSFLLTVANMAGVALTELDRGLVLSLLTGSALGTALLVRSVALVLCAGVAPRPAPLILAGGLAVATLAWSGHAAASQGLAGWLRLGGDVAHLLGALGWFGALVLFAALLWRPLARTTAMPGTVTTALSTFAFAGTAIVALLMLTGAANLWFLVAMPDLPQLVGSLYGRLLLIKLAVFVAMLGLAALNRFALVPRLECAKDTAARQSTIRKLRLSVSTELLAALAVLGLVAWLGTLDPLGIGS